MVKISFKSYKKFSILGFIYFAMIAFSFDSTINLSSAQTSDQLGNFSTKKNSKKNSKSEESEKDCGLSCHYQKAYESALFQMRYVQNKSDLLKEEWRKDPQSDEVKNEISSFCRKEDYDQNPKVCYTNAQLFLAASISRYQDALKEIADNKSKLTTGRMQDGSIKANAISLESNPDEEIRKLHIPKASELREAFLKAYGGKGVLELKSNALSTIWKEMLYVGKDPNRPEVFQGVAGKLKKADSADAQSSSQVYERDSSGNIIKDSKLSENNKTLKTLYEKKIKQNADSFQNKKIDLKKDFETPKNGEGSLSYRAFVETRKELVNTYSNEVKKLDSKKGTSKANANSKILNQKNEKQKNIEVGNEPGVPAKGSVVEYNFDQKIKDEESQPEIKSNDTNYNVNHSGLNETLNKDALNEAKD